MGFIVLGKTTGQVLGSITGAITGFVLGGPAGAIQGASLGYSLGTLADPPDLPSTTGPRLDDKQYQSATYGGGIPVLYGDTAFRGTIIYLENGEYKEVATKETTGGKGSTPKQEHTTYKYYATFAVAFCESISGAKIRRIWIGADLVFNADSDDLATQIQSSRFQSGGDGWIDGAGQPIDSDFTENELTQGGAGFMFYDGTQTDPDPRIEAVLGVGNAPAYTGTAYMIFYDLDLAPYGNNLSGAQVKVEFVKGGATANETLISSVESVFSGSHAGGTPVTWYVTPQKTISQYVLNNFPTWTTYKTVTTPFDWEGPTVSGDADTNNANPISGGICDNSSLDFFDTYRPFGSPIISDRFQLRQGVFATFDASTKELAVCTDVYSNQRIFSELVVTYTPRGVAISDDYIFVVAPVSSQLHIYTYDHSLNLVDNWNTGVTWTGSTGEARQFYDSGFLYFTQDITGNSFTLRKFDVINQVVGDTFTISGGSSITSGTFNRAHNMAVYGNLCVSTHYYLSKGVRTRIHTLYDFNRTGEALNTVIEDLCNRAGIPDASLDLTALSSDTVRGFLANFPGSARANISVLATAFLFDLIEDGYTLKAVKRGGSSVKTITQEELDARPFGNEPGVKISRDIEMNNRLPSRYMLTYIDYNREYDNNTQTAEFSSNTENVREESLPIVLTSDEGIQLAEIMGKISWIERNVVSFTLSLEHVDLIPSDVIYLETSPDNYEYLRITDKTELADQRVDFIGKVTDSAIYSSTLSGVSGEEPDQTITFIGDSTFIGIDCPMLIDSTDDYGLVTAMYGPGNYPGGILMYSLDSGQTYNPLQSFAGAVTVGIAKDTLAVNDGFVMDRSGTLNIDVRAGEFTGITETQMLTGQNYVAYGVDGRWEIMQFAGATLESDGTYTLDTFVRGLKGTEQYTGTHAVGDYVVLLGDPDVAFLTMDSSDVGVSRSYKPVTVGQQTQYVDEVTFTYNAVNLKCLSGVHPAGNRNGSNNWIVDWYSRTRYNSSFWVTGTQPDDEDTDSFEVDIMNGASVVRTITSSTTSITYTSAQQTTDFGSVQSSIEVNIYQISNTGARGYALNATFTV